MGDPIPKMCMVLGLHFTKVFYNGWLLCLTGFNYTTDVHISRDLTNNKPSFRLKPLLGYSNYMSANSLKAERT
jgi:hypothetical protein